MLTFNLCCCILCLILIFISPLQSLVINYNTRGLRYSGVDEFLITKRDWESIVPVENAGPLTNDFQAWLQGWVLLFNLIEWWGAFIEMDTADTNLHDSNSNVLEVMVAEFTPMNP